MTIRLLIKQLLHTPLATAPDQEIVYRDLARHTYREMRDRIGQLASGLSKLGVKPGDTVAIMDWDSHRYLECFFAVPMMGAVLQTVNVRLNPEQILYTLNHAGPKVLLVNSEFLPLIESFRDRIETIEKFVLISDAPHAEQAAVPLECEYEVLLLSGSADYDFPDFDENTRATTFYTTGTTGLPKGVYFSHRQLVLHTLAETAALALAPTQGRLHRDDVYMPITPMFHVHAWGFPYAATMAGLKQVYPGRYSPEGLLGTQGARGRDFLALRADHSAHDAHPSENRRVDLTGWKIIIGGSALPTGLAETAINRGIDIFAGYGMSETCPILTLSHVKRTCSTGSGRQGRQPAGQGRPADSAGRSADRRPRHEGRRPRWQGGRRNRRARALADAGLSQKSRGLRGAVGRRLPAHERHRQSSTPTAMSRSPTASRT